MTTRQHFLTLLALTFAIGAQAQDDPDKKQVTIDELRSPTSPAFTILGVTPTNVVRPNTPRELAVELLSATERGEGDLPSDLALEIAPYWLFDHPELTFEKYYDASIGETILRSLSISVATSDIPDETVAGTSLGLGVRFLLLAGDKHPDLDAKVRALKNVQLKFLRECVDFMPEDSPPAPAEGEAGAAAVESTTSSSSADIAFNCPNSVREAYEANFKKVGSEIGALQRPGWVVEAAFASSRDYPDDDDVPSSGRQVGAWLTASYKMSKPSELTFLAAARVLEDRTGDDNVRMKDIGGRLIYEPAHMPLSFSLEVMHRDIEDGDSSTSTLAVLEYPINDALRLVASYGKGLATPTNDSDLQATISLNFGFGKGPSVSFDKLGP